MKIAVCGAPTVGKTRFVESFIDKWNGYKAGRVADEQKALMVPSSRDDIAALDKLLNFHVDDAMFYEGKADVVHDGCLMDSMAHIFSFFGRHQEAKSDVMQKYTALFRTAIQYYDIIFYISFNNRLNQENDKVIMTSDEFMFLTGLDNIYNAMYQTYMTGEDSGLFPFSTKEGCPPIIELAGTTDERIKLAQLYINEDGSAYGKENSLLTDFFTGNK